MLVVLQPKTLHILIKTMSLVALTCVISSLMNNTQLIFVEFSPSSSRIIFSGQFEKKLVEIVFQYEGIVVII